jgi:membrane fusion protein (multidrug efflux system)
MGRGTMTETQTLPHNGRKKALIIMTLIFLMIALSFFIYWWKWGRFNEYTDDAYVSGNLVYVTPQVNGIVTSIYADDTWYVEKGQVLIELDPTDFIIAVEKKKANLAQIVRKVAQLFAQTRKTKAQIRIAKADFIKSAEDYERREILVQSGSISEEDLTHSIAKLTSSYFSLVAAEQNYFSLLSQVENTTISTHPLVKQAIEELKTSWVNLKRSTIKAPTNGLIAQRKAQIGERVQGADPLLAIVPLEEIWVEANFKENQIGSMQVGQKAVIRTDIYGRSVIYEGEIIGIGGGTGSIFSILPPQNATGNWIKIVQRVPIRISLPIEKIVEHPLRLGLSTEVNVDIHPLEDPCPPQKTLSTPLYTTTIFAEEEEGINDVIETIIQSNLPSFPASSLELGEM